MFDYYSLYKNITRNLILRKNGLIINSYKIPNISKISYSFRLYKLEDLDDVQIYIIYIFLNFFLVERVF